MILNYHFCRNKHFTIKYDLTLSSANIFPKTNTIYSREITSTKGKDNFYCYIHKSNSHISAQL